MKIMGKVYGSATAHQCEGGNEDGRGLSIWDEFSHNSDKNINNVTGMLQVTITTGLKKTSDDERRWPKQLPLFHCLAENSARGQLERSIKKVLTSITE